MSALSIQVDSLRSRLPRHAPAMARLSRMLPAMARQAQLEATLLVSAREPVIMDPARVLIESDAGRALLRFDLASSPALESIAADRNDARRVALANLYLSPWLAALQPAHTGALVVRAVGRDVGREVGREVGRDAMSEDAHDMASLSGLSLMLGTDMPCVVDAIDPSLADALARGIDDAAASRDGHRVTGRMAGRLHIATRTLRLDVLQSLRAGDVLLGWPLRAPFTAGAPLHGLSLRWGAAHGMQAHATVSVEGSTLILQSPLTMIHDTQDLAADAAPDIDVPLEAPQAMEGDTDDNRTAQADVPVIDLGPMTVPVRVELVTLDLSLDAIAALHAGSIVELPAPLDGAIVQLVCCGNTVASGQLVAVGDNLGVRIVQPLQATVDGH